MQKFWENLQYVVLVLLIVGQCVVSSNFWIGQFAYLLSNLISVSRCFKLNRPTSDKVKDCACLGITFSLVILKSIKMLFTIG